MFISYFYWNVLIKRWSSAMDSGYKFCCERCWWRECPVIVLNFLFANHTLHVTYTGYKSLSESATNGWNLNMQESCWGFVNFVAAIICKQWLPHCLHGYTPWCLNIPWSSEEYRILLAWFVGDWHYFNDPWYNGAPFESLVHDLPRL